MLDLTNLNAASIQPQEMNVSQCHVLFSILSVTTQILPQSSFDFRSQKSKEIELRNRNTSYFIHAMSVAGNSI